MTRQTFRRPAMLALPLLVATLGPALGQSAQPEKPAAPSNQIGQQFELPRVGDKAQQVELITGLCGVQMKGMSKPACHCLAEQSLTVLSDPQRDYLIASVVAPPVADRMMKDGRVGQPDQEVIFRFLSATSDGCASGTFDAARAKAAEMPATPPSAPAAASVAPVAPKPAN